MNMKKITLITAITVLFACIALQAQDGPRLLIRGDDIGSTHGANLGCIKAYEEGIMRSVEIMVPCPWFPEAVRMLKETPGLDVGVHITMTSEWENLKWGPLTPATSITDENGYFFPMVTTRNIFPEEVTLNAADWRLEEIEADELFRRLPVIILTTSKAEEDRIRSYDLGANAYIVKPVGFENFSLAVRTINLFWQLVDLPE